MSAWGTGDGAGTSCLLFATSVPEGIRRLRLSFRTGSWPGALLQGTPVNSSRDPLQSLQSGIPTLPSLLLQSSLTAKTARCRLPLLGKKTVQVWVPEMAWLVKMPSQIRISSWRNVLPEPRVQGGCDTPRVDAWTCCPSQSHLLPQTSACILLGRTAGKLAWGSPSCSQNLTPSLLIERIARAPGWLSHSASNS